MAIDRWYHATAVDRWYQATAVDHWYQATAVDRWYQATTIDCWYLLLYPQQVSFWVASPSLPLRLYGRHGGVGIAVSNSLNA